MAEWKKYRRKGFVTLRPYIEGEDLSGISVSDADTPQPGGMIARNPQNHQDQWYVAKDFFDKNYEEADKDTYGTMSILVDKSGRWEWENDGAYGYCTIKEALREASNNAGSPDFEDFIHPVKVNLVRCDDKQEAAK